MNGDLNDKIYSKGESSHSKNYHPELHCTEISDGDEQSPSISLQPNLGIQASPMEDETACTQKILENPVAAALKKKMVKRAAKKKTVAEQPVEKTMFQKQQEVLAHPLIGCLIAYWDVAMVVHALELLNRMKARIMKEKLKVEYTVWGAMKTILKVFVTNIKKELANLEHVSLEDFRAWLSRDGFSTIYGNLQAVDSIGTFDSILFDTLSDLIIEQSSTEVSYSSPNITNTSMSSTTVHTQDALAVAGTSKPSKSTKYQSEEEEPVTTEKASRVQKATKKRHITKDASSESEEEVAPRKKNKKRVSFQKNRSAETENESNTDEGGDQPFKPEAFDDMVDAFMQAASTASTIGRISQSISLESRGDVITLTTPGERGHKVIKLEIYDFHECCRSKPQDWWKKAEWRSKTIVASETSSAMKLVDQLKTTIMNKIQEIKNLKVERKPRN